MKDKDVFISFYDEDYFKIERRLVCMLCGRWKIHKRKKLLPYPLLTRKKHKHSFKIKEVSINPFRRTATDVGVAHQTYEVMLS